MSRLIMDCEANELLRRVTRCWIVAWKDLDTGKKYFCLEGDLSWQDAFNKATVIIGHNILGYDFPMLEKLFRYKLPRSVGTQDTLIMSQVLDYKRFGHDGHSLGRWGESLGYPKEEWTDFSKYSPGMLKYCMNDLEVTERVYYKLVKEFEALMAKAPNIAPYLRAEHYVSEWCAQAELHGWPFDRKQGQILFEVFEKEMQAAVDQITPKMGKKTVAVDKCKGIIEEKWPKWVKNGNYAKFTADWFGIDPATGQNVNRLVEGPYSRVTFPDLKLSSSDDVKIFLFRHGWEPTEWNYTKDSRGNKVRSSGKITEDSLEFLGGDGKIYCDYLSTKARYGILKGWLNEIDENDRLHGECFTIGTPSMRARHSIIANIPSVDAAWGKEMRQLFICKEGWTLVGCDSAGNQARGLAHYLGSAEYVDLLLNGDIHAYNAQVSTNVLKSMGIDHTVPRSVAKRLLYAFLFGAAGAKLWLYIFGESNAEKGDKFKNGFTKAVPGLSELTDKLKRIFKKTSMAGEGYIPGIAGNRIYCDSFHKLLVYLLQACEKATCGAAVMMCMQNLEKEGIPYQPVVFYHDEIDFMVPTEHAERARVIGREAFRDGPKLFGVQIMDGGDKIGKDWYEIH